MNTNNNNTPKPHPHAELIKAWADGAKIQYWNESRHEWIDKGDPCWYEWCEYRIKPEENEPWKPKKGEEYKYLVISFDGFEVYSKQCNERNNDKIGIEMGNCFRTREEAFAAAERIKAALKGDFASDNNVARKEPELDGKPLTDGEKALIRALRDVEIYHVFGWNKAVICTSNYRPAIGGLGVSVSHRAVAMLPSIATSVDKEKAIIAALEQIKSEREEIDE